MTACPPPVFGLQDPELDQISDPPEPDFTPDLPSLCTPIAQVLDFDCNPFQRKDLYKQEVVRWLALNGFPEEAAKIEHCGTSFIHLKCPNGHEKYVRLYCKREFCPTCGENGSREHKKRTTRAIDRLIWAPVLGYMIFTLPDTVSQSKPDKDTLKHLQKEVYSIIQRHFDTPGALVRIHFVGNQIGQLHIHLNVLFPILGTNGIGKIDPEKLTRIRKEWTNFINSYFKMSCEDTNIHYNFATTAKKKYHKIKYVLRPVTGAFEFYTLSNPDKKYILSLRGWHNTRWFGKLSNNSYKKYLAAKGINPTAHIDKDPYLSKTCPACGGKFKYQGLIYKGDITYSKLRWLDNDILIDLEIYAALKAEA